MTGASPAAMVALLEGLRADAIGVNCSLGPAQLKGVVDEILQKASVPVIVKPNAGLPFSDGERTFYDVGAEEFARDVCDMIKDGVCIAGGCCGTTPEYIRELVKGAENIPFKYPDKKNIACVSSYTHCVEFGYSPVLIGERINPTGKKRFKQALKDRDLDYILGEGLNQQEKGVHILDVNVGLPEIDEKEMITSVVCELQAVSALPLQIDTSDALAMESALRRYNGKAMVNSVNGKEESMRAVFPLVKKYGGLVVALTLDEKGIPDTAEGRINIAKKILSVAAKYGIEKKDIIFDTLAMAVSADADAPSVTLQSLYYIRNTLKVNTSLGVSNVSFGLPLRDAVNSAFFALALENGLSAAIMNPYSGDMLKTYYAFCALKGIDENCARYIDFASGFVPDVPSVQKLPSSVGSEITEKGSTSLRYAIIKGLKDQAGAICGELLNSINPLDIVNDEIIPRARRGGKGVRGEKSISASTSDERGGG